MRLMILALVFDLLLEVQKVIHSGIVDNRRFVPEPLS